jgi:magnesium transporter
MELYDAVVAYLEAGRIEALKALLNQQDIAKLLDLIQELGPARRAIIFRLLDKGVALRLFEQFGSETRKDLLLSFHHDQAVDVFAGLASDERARLLDELPAGVTKRLVETLPRDERRKLDVLLGYPPETAGRIMTPDYVRLTREMTVEQALRKIRQVGQDRETVYVLYVTDDQRKLEGEVSLQTLVMAELDQTIAEIMQEDVPWVVTDTDQEEAAQIIKQQDLLALAVVDREQRLVGIVTVDDAMEILEEEMTEDFLQRVAIAPLGREKGHDSYQLVHGPIWRTWLIRVPFLVITLIGGLAAGGVIDSYEEAIAAIPALAIFIPVVMDAGGNAGTQSSTIFARALVLGHISSRQMLRHLLREMAVGFTIGTILGILTGGIVLVWQRSTEIAWVVGIALMATTTLATTLGFLIPYGLQQVGVDPAAGADPIITTIKDITGLLIYFGLAILLLGAL